MKIKENREIKPKQSSLPCSKLQPYDSCKLKHSVIREICSKTRLRVSFFVIS
ncbi:hypothetical protein Hanom_Chr07g00588011 [Helianthus anomalus]